MLMIVTLNRNNSDLYVYLFSSPLLIINENYTHPYSNSKEINESRVEVYFLYNGEHKKCLFGDY